MIRRLEYPAPRRCWYSVTTGDKRAQATRPWTLRDVQDAVGAGMYFVRGAHEFASVEAERAAGFNRRGPGMKGWLKKLSQEELEALRELLEKEAS